MATETDKKQEQMERREYKERIEPALQEYIAKEMKAYRKKNKLSQKAFARNLKISERAYQGIEGTEKSLSSGTTLLLFMSMLTPEEQLDFMARIKECLE